MMETDLLTAHEMCERLKVSFETFRKTWRRWKFVNVGRGADLRSARFYWQNGPVRAEESDGNIKIPDQERGQMGRGYLPGRGESRTKGRIHKPQGGRSLGRGEADLATEARRLGLT